ncbi:hypothetical protein Clacol_002249 [Clathrus columnatus]|uniref:C3H1-type domain-containing protein n=1 Tax=Clathrus columnatus TaxID=1419009 RepID=A0AAV5A079_9AGAM|nr:hypothetical protein Clacol_002249 [Clathrus columnatus]
MAHHSHRTLCKFFATPKGCRLGNKCRFAHTTDNPPTQSSRGPRLNDNFVRNEPIEPPPDIPRGTCRFYWQQGNCHRGFECTYQHTRSPSDASLTPVADTVDSPPDIFSIEGMMASTGIRTEHMEFMSPIQAHNHIKHFLRATYYFENAARVQGFVKVIASINDRNKAWAFLDLMVKGDGIVRIGEVLRFKPISEHIGLTRGALSFQVGYFPILEYLSSNLVLKSTWQKNINLLYTVVEDNFERLSDVLQACVGNMINNRSWEDRTTGASITLDGAVIFRTLSTVLLQYVNRFKSSIRNHPELVVLVNNLVDWFDIWAKDISSIEPSFTDNITRLPPSTRRNILDTLREEINRLSTIIQRETNNDAKLKKPFVPPISITAAQLRDANILQFTQTYDPPGDLRPEGKRHDNDHEDISMIRIAPTHEELLSSLTPYLPVFRPEAPHHHQEDSMERHLDIQFRLLREEFMSPIRSSVTAIHDDLTRMWQSPGGGNRQVKRELTKLEGILENKGGAYKTSGLNSLFFFIYTNVEFAPVKAERRDLTVGLVMDTPPGNSRDADATKRYAYWKHSRRLTGGNLVALVIISRDELEVYLGTIAWGSDIAESSKRSPDRIQLRISFFDPLVELKALKNEKISRRKGHYAFLIDNSVMFEASRPFLEKLQTVEPTEIPFAKYIARTSESLENIKVFPPRYTASPQFKYEIGSLFTEENKPMDSLNIQDPLAVEAARQHLIRGSCLDPSQVEAMINTLTREVSLIQGPPGTGKSYIGRKILDVLIQSQIRPIILIAYTNHALDHMLTSVLDEKITKRIVRLGSRSSDERILEYSLDKIERIAHSGELGRSLNKQYSTMKRTEEEIARVMQSIQLPLISMEQVNGFLQIRYPEHAETLLNPPFWIQSLCTKMWADEEKNGGWTKVEGRQKSGVVIENLSRTYYGFWRDATDIAYITPPVKIAKRGTSEEEKQKLNLTGAPIVATDPTTTDATSTNSNTDPTTTDVASTDIPDVEIDDSPMAIFFSELGYGNDRPTIPTEDRDLDSLMTFYNVWSMSAAERRRISELWDEEIRKIAYENNLEAYKELRERYKEACKEYNDIKDESIRPRVIMVEEAGQVLEAHVITSLASSVQHLICIGDPQQLRPTLATFSLSMDSTQGNELFKFDRSLMERLANGGIPMTQINVQRQILYPKLEDHELVTKYPPVQGMASDVYFLTHMNPEAGLEDSVSKYNTYEVEMIRDLVLYFLKQGTYSGPGDIVVLCAYLGQLQRVRQALRDLKISVSVDERDEEQLAKQGMEGDTSLSTFEEVVVAKHIRLGTVDIYQGQEAKIVIVSLVRNTGNFDTQSSSIGFLKSSNRINVALSRAKHGLYILGNASNLRKSPTWSKIIDELEIRHQVGPGFAIKCARHSGETQTISKPGQLNAYSPEGGCLIPCAAQLPCGHICPSMLFAPETR